MDLLQPAASFLFGLLDLLIAIVLTKAIAELKDVPFLKDMAKILKDLEVTQEEVKYLKEKYDISEKLVDFID